MQNDYSAFPPHHRWWADIPCVTNKIPAPLNRVIYDRGSLTQVLIDLSDGAFAVNVLSQKITIPYAHEQRKLVRPLSRAAIVREVELMLHNEPVVFARSVIPLSLSLNAAAPVRDLGSKPLGHLLFKDGKIRVSKREFAQIGSVYARRTPYDYQGCQVLVAEYFLPALLDYC